MCMFVFESVLWVFSQNNSKWVKAIQSVAGWLYVHCRPTCFQSRGSICWITWKEHRANLPRERTHMARPQDPRSHRATTCKTRPAGQVRPATRFCPAREMFLNYNGNRPAAFHWPPLHYTIDIEGLADLEQTGEYEIGGNLYNNLRYADDVALLATTEGKLQELVNAVGKSS